MLTPTTKYRAIFSSDWSECLSPCGPFDFLAVNFPELSPKLDEIFRSYTGNLISLGEACHRIQTMLPGPVTEEMMDAYLDRWFSVYQGVPELIDWCRGRGILFMINTTGMIGYFQRVLAKGLLPPVPVLSANPMFRFPSRDSDPPIIHELFEIRDKGKNTAAISRSHNIPASQIILMGDSGGDGPHFEWGHQAGGFLIGSMTKHSLDAYCRRRGFDINLRFGVSYGPGQKRDVKREMQVNFMDLVDPIQKVLQF